MERGFYAMQPNNLEIVYGYHYYQMLAFPLLMTITKLQCKKISSSRSCSDMSSISCMTWQAGSKRSWGMIGDGDMVEI